MTATRHWYAVHTRPHHEASAEVNLSRQGFETYLPRYLRRCRHARKSELVPRPLFPRYLFVKIDSARDRWRAIHSTFGVNHLVLAGELPAQVPDAVVSEIRAREDSNGFVTLGLPAGIAPGSQVRVIDGIFAEARGILERIAGEHRVAVLLGLLGREVRVLVPAASIGAV
jgi:transcriptional antiterminator RfaH